MLGNLYGFYYSGYLFVVLVEYSDVDFGVYALVEDLED